MSSKTGSQAQIRVVREETIEAQPPMPQISMPLPEATDTLGADAAEAAARMEEISSQFAPHRLATTALQDHPTTTTTEARNLRDLSRVFQVAMGVHLTVSMVLAVRLMLLVAVSIAGLLAWKTLEEPTMIALSISAAFNLCVVVPIVALYWKRG
jgi:hypothetical protein